MIGFIGVITGFYNLRFQKVPHQSIFLSSRNNIHIYSLTLTIAKI